MADGRPDHALTLARRLQILQLESSTARAALGRRLIRQSTGRYFRGDILSVRIEHGEKDEEGHSTAYAGMTQYYARFIVLYGSDGHTLETANLPELVAVAGTCAVPHAWTGLCRWIEDRSDRAESRLPERRASDLPAQRGPPARRSTDVPDLLQAFEVLRRALFSGLDAQDVRAAGLGGRDRARLPHFQSGSLPGTLKSVMKGVRRCSDPGRGVHGRVVTDHVVHMNVPHVLQWVNAYSSPCILQGMTTPDLAPLLEGGVIDGARAAAFIQIWWHLSQTLGYATTPDEVIGRVVREGVRVLGADAGTVLLPNADGTALIVRGSRGYEPQHVDGWHTIPLSRSLPSTVAYQTRHPVYMDSVRSAIDMYPALSEVLASTTGSLAALPLQAGDQVLGVLSLSFHQARQFDHTDQAFLLFLASQCALALQRNAALEAAHQLNAQLHYLAEASNILSRSLDMTEILDSIAQLAIPQVADWCVIYLPQHDRLVPVTIAHQDPSMVALLKAYTTAHPIHTTSDTGVGRAFVTGQAELLPTITDEMYDASPLDAAEKEEVLQLQLRSIITVPMVAAGHVVGVLGLGRTSLDRAFTPDDLDFAQQVANRAGKAVENARLHRELSQELTARRAMQQALDDTNAHLEDRVRERTEELMQLNEELQAFAHSVSHDLRTPIRHITSFADLLTRHLPPDNERAAQALTQVKRGAQRLTQTVDGLITLSRSSQMALALTDIDLRTVVERLVSDLDADTARHPVEWRIGPLPAVHGDLTLLTLVFQNLLHNAVKFTSHVEHPIIEVNAARSPGTTIISVHDNGPGFDAEYAHKLFQPFQRLHAATEFEGTGLGLANVRRIIQRHNGQVWAASAHGQGATFTFTLPD